MNRPPLGKVCMELGLLDDDAVERILTDMREHGHGRFGELAVGLNLLSEEDLASALAHQFHLTLLSPQRVAELSVPPEVLALLPARLMRSRVLLPTFFDADRRQLTLVTSDPTDLPALQAAQRHVRAHHLRIFVAARSALAARLDVVLPADTDDDPSSTGLDLLAATGGTVVLEPDVEIAAALRRRERAEGGRTEIVSDPEQVTALLLARLADRVLYRVEHTGSAAPYLPMWRKARPEASIAAVQGFSPGRRVAVAWADARDFYQRLVLWVLSVGESRRHALRAKLRAGWTLARELGSELGLSQERLEAVSLAALLSPLGGLGILDPPEGTPATAPRPIDGPADLLARLAPPFDLAGLYAAVDRRAGRPARPTDDLGVEVLLVVRHAVDRDVSTAIDPVDLLPADLDIHARVLTALSRVLKRRALRSQLLTGGRRHAQVVVATRSVVQATELEDKLSDSGFSVVIEPDATLALARVRELQPAAVALADDLGGEGTLRLLAEIRRDTLLADTPSFLLTTTVNPPPAALVELRPDDISRPPHDLDALCARLAVAVARPRTGRNRSASATGDSQLLPISDVVQILRDGRQTAEIRLVTADDSGRIQVIDGHLSTARLGRKTGMAAWRAACEVADLRYAVAFGPSDDSHEDDTISVTPD